jgi:hypothetical protein
MHGQTPKMEAGTEEETEKTDSWPEEDVDTAIKFRCVMRVTNRSSYQERLVMQRITGYPKTQWFRGE